jgi:hypothetical protein
LIDEITHRNWNNQSTNFQILSFAKAVRQSRQSGPLPQPRDIDEEYKKGYKKGDKKGDTPEPSL